jgi:hypothetical protein
MPGSDGNHCIGMKKYTPFIYLGNHGDLCKHSVNRRRKRSFFSISLLYRGISAFIHEFNSIMDCQFSYIGLILIFLSILLVDQRSILSRSFL